MHSSAPFRGRQECPPVFESQRDRIHVVDLDTGAVLGVTLHPESQFEACRVVAVREAAFGAFPMPDPQPAAGSAPVGVDGGLLLAFVVPVSAALVRLGDAGADAKAAWTGEHPVAVVALVRHDVGEGLVGELGGRLFILQDLVEPVHRHIDGSLEALRDA